MSKRVLSKERAKELIESGKMSNININTNLKERRGYVNVEEVKKVLGIFKSKSQHTEMSEEYARQICNLYDLNEFVKAKIDKEPLNAFGYSVPMNERDYYFINRVHKVAKLLNFAYENKHDTPKTDNILTTVLDLGFEKAKIMNEDYKNPNSPKIIYDVEKLNTDDLYKINEIEKELMSYVLDKPALLYYAKNHYGEMFEEEVQTTNNSQQKQDDLTLQR